MAKHDGQTTASSSAIGKIRERRRADLVNLVVPIDTRAEILSATERLLFSAPLHEITVEGLLREAGVSRATFYAHFESKFDAAAALMDRVMGTMFELLSPFVDRQPGVSADAAIRLVLDASSQHWKEHAPVFRAIHDHRHSVAELRTQWLEVTRRFTEAVVGQLEREQAEGQISGTLDVRQVAASLVWSTEHLLYVAGSGIDTDLPGETAIIDTIVGLWVGAIYGRYPEPRA